MSQNTFFNILAILGILYGIWRLVSYIAAAAFVKDNFYYGAKINTSTYIFSVLGTITFFAGCYKLFVW